MNKILWVEDEADTSLVMYRTKLESQLDFDLTIIRNATDVISCLRSEIFDAIIVDVRIPPGTGREWVQLYLADNNSLHFEQLGIMLIHNIINLDKTVLPENRLIDKIGIFSIERHVDIINISKSRNCEETLHKIKYLYKKDAELPEDLLLFVKKLIVK